MKEIYLAMDDCGDVWGYSNMPCRGVGEWIADGGTIWRSETLLINYGIDVTKFPLTHEKPIKIRAVWEVVND